MKLTLSLFLVVAAYAQAPIRGFFEGGLAKQRALEAQLLAQPDPARIEAHMKAMASEPHHAGSPASRKVAEYALKEFRTAGLEAKVETFEALLPYPKERALSLGKYILVELYTDGTDAASEQNQKVQESQFATVAIPYYVILDAEGKTVRGFPGLTKDPQEFLKVLVP